MDQQASLDYETFHKTQDILHKLFMIFLKLLNHPAYFPFLHYSQLLISIRDDFLNAKVSGSDSDETLHFLLIFLKNLFWKIKKKISTDLT
jgi:hypothetical protein